MRKQTAIADDDPALCRESSRRAGTVCAEGSRVRKGDIEVYSAPYWAKDGITPAKKSWPVSVTRSRAVAVARVRSDAGAGGEGESDQVVHGRGGRRGRRADRGRPRPCSRL